VKAPALVVLARANAAKHGISFDEATTVFDNPRASIFPDEWHSQDEQRELIIGNSALNRVVVVCFTERAEGTVRIVTARRATAREKRDSEAYLPAG
jgi:uncharacterized protein